MYRNLLHGFDLRVTTDSAYRDSHINRWSDTTQEKIGFQENLAVRDGNHIGWNVGRYIPRLGLNDGKCCQRTSALYLAL